LTGGAVTTLKDPEAIIVGAGHNGLVAACYLARSGLKVLVLESAALHRRRGGEPPLVPGLHVLELLLRLQPAAAGNHPHAGTAEIRPAVIPYEGGCTMMQGRRPLWRCTTTTTRCAAKSPGIRSAMRKPTIAIRAM
jgi:2-polyprenyl-6-methoxyphenol hydroxylase-like FAD-dependent oxidoreductase